MQTNIRYVIIFTDKGENKTMAKMGRPKTGWTTDRVTISVDKGVLASTRLLAKNSDMTLSKYITMVLAKNVNAIGQN